MNSLDPWRVMQSSPPAARMAVPAPYYGHPFYAQRGARAYGVAWPTPTLKDFIGAEAVQSPGARRTGLTAEVAPVLAPATGGITARVELDQHQHLHAEICVDGRCYKSCIDLAPAIAAVMAKIAQGHTNLHKATPTRAPVISGDVVLGAIDKAVGAAGDALIGAMIDQHVGTACSGWLGDLGHAVKAGVTGAASGVASTFKRFKGPIAAAAAIAAASAAAAIPGVGPIAAPMAGKFANDLVQSAAGDKSAQKRVAQAAQQATSDKTIAVALSAAKQAVAHATVAHHVQDTAKKAAAGQSAAQQEIAKVAVDAEKGDPAAKAVADLVANAFKSEWGAKLWESATGRGPATVSGWPWYAIVGAPY